MEIIEEAIKASKNSYSPYSNFKVGAAILLDNGEYIHGCNVENVSYGLSICAERNALFQLVSKGQKGHAVAMAIVGDTKNPISPCGACRQVMLELLPKDIEIYLANMKGLYKKTSLEELLPNAFVEVENGKDC